MGFESLGGLLSGIAVVVVAVLFFLLLFEPGLPYRFTRPQSANDSREFVDFLSAIVNARLFSAGEVDVLNSGAAIYAAELAAIRGAKRSIHLEAYLFLRGRIADEILRPLLERARPSPAAAARMRCSAPSSSARAPASRCDSSSIASAAFPRPTGIFPSCARPAASSTGTSRSPGTRSSAST